jgi:hypothetical protein
VASTPVVVVAPEIVARRCCAWSGTVVVVIDIAKNDAFDTILDVTISGFWKLRDRNYEKAIPHNSLSSMKRRKVLLPFYRSCYPM